MTSLAGRLEICLKSFFVQAAWNPERMQNVGFLFGIRSALKKIWRRDSKEFETACERASSLFNTHPYFVPAMMGLTIHVEEKVAAGELPVSAVEYLKSKIAAPLNALGSLWFWDHLRLLVFLLAVPFLLIPDPAGVVAGAVLYFAVFNYFHFTTRWRGLKFGLTYGEDMVGHILKMFPSSMLQSVRRLCVFFLGILAPLVLAALFESIQRRLPGLPDTFPVPHVFFLRLLIALAILCGSVVLLHRRWVSVYQLLAAGLVLAMGLARWA